MGWIFAVAFLLGVGASRYFRMPALLLSVHLVSPGTLAVALWNGWSVGDGILTACMFAATMQTSYLLGLLLQAFRSACGDRIQQQIEHQEAQRKRSPDPLLPSLN